MVAKRSGRRGQNVPHLEEMETLRRRVEELEQELLHRNQSERDSIANTSDVSDDENPFYHKRAETAPTLEECLANALENPDCGIQMDIANF